MGYAEAVAMSLTTSSILLYYENTRSNGESIWAERRTKKFSTRKPDPDHTGGGICVRMDYNPPSGGFFVLQRVRKDESSFVCKWRI